MTSSLSSMQLTHDDALWYAGFQEGEGTVCTDISHGNRFVVSIAQNDPAPLNYISQIFGGKVRQRVRKSPASEKICTGHDWKIHGEKAQKFMSSIRPQMRIPYKIQQYENAYTKSLEKSDRIFSCKECGKSYQWRPNLSRHVRTVHKS